jgi:hypothetical protein
MNERCAADLRERIDGIHLDVAFPLRTEKTINYEALEGFYKVLSEIAVYLDNLPSIDKRLAASIIALHDDFVANVRDFEKQRHIFLELKNLQKFLAKVFVVEPVYCQGLSTRYAKNDALAAQEGAAQVFSQMLDEFTDTGLIDDRMFRAAVLQVEGIKSLIKNEPFISRRFVGLAVSLADRLWEESDLNVWVDVNFGYSAKLDSLLQGCLKM